MLKKLDFAGRRIREEQLRALRTDANTFEWVWSSPFADWISGLSQVFWINGKPASGKSTLVQYLVSKLKAKSRPQFPKSDILYHFFDFRDGIGVRNNLEGLFRSLLRQVLEHRGSEAVEAVRALHSQFSDHEVSVAALEEELKVQIGKLTSPTLIFLDGLDEYEGKRWDLLKSIREMTSRKVRICLVSRPEPEFVASLGDVPSLVMQNYNKPGIRQYVYETLDTFVRDKDFHDDPFMNGLKAEIVRESNGVFLWARLATYELASSFAKGESPELISQRLRDIPPELNQVYSRILKRLEAQERQQAFTILQLVCFAKRNLALEELFAGLKQVYTDEAVVTSFEHRRDLQKLAKRASFLTGGLVEVFWQISPEDGQPEHNANEAFQKSVEHSADGLTPMLATFAVQFISSTHRSVRAYLESREWADLQLDLNLHCQGPEQLWLEICVKQFPPSFVLDEKGDPFTYSMFLKNCLERGLRVPQVGKTIPRLESGWLHDSEGPRYSVWPYQDFRPLLGYASSCIFDYAAMAESMGTSTQCYFSCMSISLVHCHWRATLYEEMFPCRNCVGASVSHFLNWNFLPRNASHCLLAHYSAIDKLMSSESKHVELETVSRLINQCHAATKDGLLQSPLMCTIELDASIKDVPINAGLSFSKFPSMSTDTLHYLISTLTDWHGPKERQLMVLDRYLRDCQEVTDDTLITAILMNDVSVVNRLLRFRPPGRLRLKPRLGHGDYIADWQPDPFIGRSDISYGPIWVSFNSVSKFSGEMMDFFLRRGEDINDQCSQPGSMLYSLILHGYPERCGNWPELDKLLNFGLNIHAIGPLGNGLELVWRCINKDGLQFGLPEYRIRRPLAKLEALLDHGARIICKDPNGCIPSVEWLRYFIKWRARCYQCKSRQYDLYRGAGSYDEMPDLAVHLCGREGDGEAESDEYHIEHMLESSENSE